MPQKYIKRRRKKGSWWKYLLTGRFLTQAAVAGKSSLTTTFPLVVGVGLVVGYLIGNIEPMPPEAKRIASHGETATEPKEKEEKKVEKKVSSFLDTVASSVATRRGVTMDVQADGRIKVAIPYRRESMEEPENYEKGENIFYITPSGSGEMAVEQETKRHMAIYGYSKEQGKGKIYIRQEGVVIKMRDKEALIRVPNVMEKLQNRDWQNFEVEWKGSPGTRDFTFQTVETDQSGQVVIRDVNPGAKTDPSGAIRPRMRMHGLK